MPHQKSWAELKEEIRHRETLPFFHEGEVWWCNVSQNIGIEIDGKGMLYLRPVLVFKKFSALGFLGIPLTTSGTTTSDRYVDFQFQNKTSRAALSQIKTFSVNRAFKRMGTIDDTDMQRIDTGFHRLFDKKFPLAEQAD